MLLGSAALGALRVGDAPYPGPVVAPTPPFRIPSGHNIFIGTNYTVFQTTTYVVYTFAGGELDELGTWAVYAQFSETSSASGFFNVVRNVDPIGGMIGSIPTPTFGVLPEVPPQVNEPGVTLYFNIGGQVPLFSGVGLVFVKPSGAVYSAAAPLVYIGPLSISTPGTPSFQGGGPAPQPSNTEDFAYIYSPQRAYLLPAGVGLNGRITVKDASGTAGSANIVITAAGGVLIDGSTQALINQNYGALTFIRNNGGWSII
jgi:hypothetical protein